MLLTPINLGMTLTLPLDSTLKSMASIQRLSMAWEEKTFQSPSVSIKLPENNRAI